MIYFIGSRDDDLSTVVTSRHLYFLSSQCVFVVFAYLPQARVLSTWPNIMSNAKYLPKAWYVFNIVDSFWNLWTLNFIFSWVIVTIVIALGDPEKSQVNSKNRGKRRGKVLVEEASLMYTYLRVLYVNYCIIIIPVIIK